MTKSLAETNVVLFVPQKRVLPMNTINVLYSLCSASKAGNVTYNRSHFAHIYVSFINNSHLRIIYVYVPFENRKVLVTTTLPLRNNASNES